ncbi:Bcr/CflA family efflux MFS transporter [Ancylobacter defluvii]|uniref:Bcr/CflA family efflux transporter n=1 Tax=Ancylobacter defluvii TaxID=1282440 RepID=A0A9W6JX25_9HYPH|nr:Bcr/CflA family efflux MFS transporter [Ancylobacter defluvii]MBS7589235.1 Bcr/CflA family efflux MFS transporter [Ancylobacter defluvii]GLK84847.1 Bcr/CflA family drug resistance efflux transporter [Ancylobacter defluvii]
MNAPALATVELPEPDETPAPVDDAAADRAPDAPRPRVNLLLMAMTTAVATFSMHVFVPALPAAAAALSASPSQIQLTVTLYLVGLALGQIVHGPISDRFGRRPVILSGISIYLVGTVGALLAPSLGTLLVARVLQSVGSCAGLVIGRATIRETSSGPGAVAALAVLASAITLSSAVAPLVGSYLSLLLGWRMLFAVLLVAAAIILLLLYLRFPETNSERSAPLSLSGMALGYGRLLRLPAFMGYSLCGAACTVTAYAFYAALPFLVGEELPHASLGIGFIYLAVVAGSILGALTARQAARRMSLDSIALIGTSGATLAAVAFLIGRAIAPDTVATLVAPLFLMTYAGGFANPGAATLAMSANPHAVGTASSLYGFIQMAVGALVTLFVGLVGHDSLSVGWIVSISMGSGLAGLLIARRSRRQHLSD